MAENEKPAPTYVLTPSYYPYPEQDEVSLLAYLNVLLKRRWQVLGLTLLTALSAWFFSRLQTPLYQAAATFLVAEKASSGVVGQGEEGVFLLKDPVAYYKKIATSSPILDRLLEQEYPHPGTGQPALLLDILEVEEGSREERLYRGRKALEEWIELSNDRTFPNVITLTLSAPSPQLAARLANQVIESLRRYDVELRTASLQERVDFIENQLSETEKKLKAAEAALENFLQRNRIVTSAQLQIEKQRLEREVSLQEELFKTLKRELELARISEKKEASAVSVIDRAVPPEHPSQPRTRLNVLLAAVVGFMLAVGFAFTAEYFTHLSAERADNREFLENVQAVKNDFRRLLLLKPKPLESPPPPEGSSLNVER